MLELEAINDLLCFSVTFRQLDDGKDRCLLTPFTANERHTDSLFTQLFLQPLWPGLSRICVTRITHSDVQHTKKCWHLFSKFKSKCMTFFGSVHLDNEEVVPFHEFFYLNLHCINAWKMCLRNIICFIVLYIYQTPDSKFCISFSDNSKLRTYV